jgi:hypothetical protein
MTNGKIEETKLFEVQTIKLLKAFHYFNPNLIFVNKAAPESSPHLPPASHTNSHARKSFME